MNAPPIEVASQLETYSKLLAKLKTTSDYGLLCRTAVAGGI
jgi:hypothetical protein